MLGLCARNLVRRYSAPVVSVGRTIQSLKESKVQLVESTDIFVFDCDGVLWKGGQAIPGAIETLSYLRDRKKAVYFVTNSTESRATIIKKFGKFGLTVEEREVLSASFAAAAYLRLNLEKDRSVYVVGEPGIAEEIRLQGLPCVDGNQYNTAKPDFSKGGRVEYQSNVGAVVVGFDPAINYYKIQYAQLCLNSIPDCKFIATNLDETCHQTDVQLWADAGAMVGALRGCTGREPIVTGKPSAFLVDYIMKNHQIAHRSRICMIGDRLDTDIVFGKQNGMKAILSLTGVTSLSMLRELANAPADGHHPDFYIHSVADLMSLKS